MVITSQNTSSCGPNTVGDRGALMATEPWRHFFSLPGQRKKGSAALFLACHHVALRWASPALFQSCKALAEYNIPRDLLPHSANLLYNWWSLRRRSPSSPSWRNGIGSILPRPPPVPAHSFTPLSDFPRWLKLSCRITFILFARWGSECNSDQPG